MTNEAAPKALVIGVGAQLGLGGELCQRFATQGHQVFVAGRTQSKLDLISENINLNGGIAHSLQCDATSEASVVQLFDSVQNLGTGKLDLVVYNVGNSTPGKIRDMDADYFQKSWEMLCFGGFLVAREITRRLLPTGCTLIFTGASASLRGKAGFAAFNSGKSALRIMAQALAKEYAAEGLHVAHVIIDGGIAGEKQFARISGDASEQVNSEQLDKFISLEGLADAYWHLYSQKQQAWTFELDLRTSLENW